MATANFLQGGAPVNLQSKPINTQGSSPKLQGSSPKLQGTSPQLQSPPTFIPAAPMQAPIPSFDFVGNNPFVEPGVSYFIADGSQIDPSTNKPFDINTPVFEAPDYMINTKEFKEKLEPLITQPVQFDDAGRALHIINTKEFKEAIDDFAGRQRTYQQRKDELKADYQFDQAAGDSYIDSYVGFKQTGQLTLPDGKTMGVSDFKAEFNKYDDLTKGSIIEKFFNIAKDTNADPAARGRALAAMDTIREDPQLSKTLKGAFGEKTGYFAGKVGGELVKGAYSLADTLTPDSLARIAKFDESSISKRMEAISQKLTNLDGYEGTLKAGEITGVIFDVAASLATGRAASVPVRLALVKTTTLAGNTLRNVGAKAALSGALADDTILLERAGDAMLDASRTVDKVGDWMDTSQIARQVVRSPVESLTFDALNNENDSFGENWLRNAVLFTAGDAALLGLVKTYKSATAASRQITAEGMSVEKFDELNNAIFQDGDDAIKFITAETAGTKSNYALANLVDRTDDVLASNNSVKALMESATRGLVDRFKAVTPMQAGELIIKGHNKGEVEKILGKELGQAYVGIREVFRKQLLRAGLKVENIDEYIFRSGVAGRQVAGRARSAIKTVAEAEGERVIPTGGELLVREGELADVGIGNTIINYVRSNMGAAINRLTAARLIQAGTVIREAAPGSSAFKAARANGGMVKITRNVDGRELETGYVATKDWLSDPTNGAYQKVEQSHPIVGDALKTVQKNSKNFKGGFYAKVDDLQKIENYSGKDSSKLREGMLPAAARLFERGQDLVLAGGIPFTPINSFGVAQMMAAMAADPRHFTQYAKAIATSWSKGQTRKFFLDKLYSDVNKANLTDMQSNGINIIPTNLFSESSDAVGIGLSQTSRATQADFFRLKDEIADANEGLSALRRKATAAETKLEKATESVANAELRTTKSAAADLTKAKKAQTTAEKESKLTKKLLTDTEKSVEDNKVALAQLEQGFQEGNVTFDLLEATGNPHINNFKEVGKDLSTVYDKVISDATFERLMPMLQYLTTESIVNKALAKGLTKADAYAEGAKSLKRFWNIGPSGAYGSVAEKLGAKSNEKRQVLSDIATILITAPKYRAAVVNRVWNTLKVLDPRKTTSLEYRLNAQWALTMGTFFVGWQLANKAISGRYTWENPTGSFDELQIPIGDDGDILRLSLFGTQLSFPRALGRAADAARRGEGEEVGQTLLGLTSVVGQPLARVVINKDWTGQPISESNMNTPQGLIDRGAFILKQYTGHPFIQGTRKTDEGNVLQGVLAAIESPIRTSNVEKSARGEFYGQVIDDINEISEEYAKQINSAYDDQELKAKLMDEQFTKIKDRMDIWSRRYGKDISELPDEMSRALLKAIVDTKTAIDLGGTDTLEGSEQISTEAAQKRLARQQGAEAGLDLYAFDDRTKDLSNVQYGAPSQIAYEFEQLIKGSKADKIPGLYDLRKKMFDDLQPLYDKARGLKGAEATAVYGEINKRQDKYLKVLMERIRPLVDRYGVNILTNNGKVLDAVAEYLVVPGDYTPFHSKKKQPYLKADAEAFIKDYYGVGSLSAKNIPTDSAVIKGIKQANADMAAGRTQAASFRLSDLQQQITAGKVFADDESMSTIKDMIKIANKRY